MNEALETLNIAVYCTICHLRPLRNKYSFEHALTRYYDEFSIQFYTWNNKYVGYPQLIEESHRILRALDKAYFHFPSDQRVKFNYKLVEYTHYAIAWYNNSFDKSHGRTREYCLEESQRWANLAINEYQKIK